jgi:hypothetical protein
VLDNVYAKLQVLSDFKSNYLFSVAAKRPTFIVFKHHSGVVLAEFW